MDEKEALLYKERNSQREVHRLRAHKQADDDYDDLSSEGSDEWWEESDSECSSCCEQHSGSSFEWESEVNENGQLFYVQSDFVVDEDGDKAIDSDKSEFPNPDGIKKDGTINKGKLLNWMRRRDCKKLQVKKCSEHSGATAQAPGQGNSTLESNEYQREKQIILKLDTIGQGGTLCEKLLGLSLGYSKEKEVVITSITPEGPAQCSNDFKIGDVIHKVNDCPVTPQNIEKILQSLKFPCEVELKVKKSDPSSSPTSNRTKFQSPFVQSLFKKNEALNSILLEQPVGIVVVDVESQNLNKDDVIYCYPEKCVLSSCRGAFVTLYHLLAEIKPSDVVKSSNVLIKKQPTNILYNSEGNYLLLIAIPQVRCSLKEATFIVEDLIRNLKFSHQTLKKCFEESSKLDLDHFFSLFFSRLLSNGFSADASRFVTLENITKTAMKPGCPEFEDIMPFATWVPLPKEAQVQIDEALNELEANDFECEENDRIDNQRLFNILGSCYFHKGYLIASHLPRDDLLDVYAFYRQNCLIQLFRNEPVKSLVIWREVFPMSVNRGLPCSKPVNYQMPTGRWFMLTVGQGFDSLTIILEAGECCKKIVGNPSPSVSYVEEVEDTLRHMHKLGITTLASQWIDNNSRFRTATPEEIFLRKANSKRDNLLGFVKTFDGPQKYSGMTADYVPKTSPASSKSGDLSPGKRGPGILDTSEDSVSQTASNVSEVSDENAPILGRRAERGKVSSENASGDSDSSDSDWDSSRDSNMRGSTCSSGIDNFYLCDVGEVLPARLTTGPDDILFYYVHLDGNEGILMNPPLNSKRSTPKMKEILQNFRKSAQTIHTILQNSIKFTRTSQENPKCIVNKSLVAVKEHGVIFECSSYEGDSSKKSVTFTYWIVGRLFFTPQPREIYVCYYEDAPQNLVEIAFRLGLSAAG